MDPEDIRDISVKTKEHSLRESKRLSFLCHLHTCCAVPSHSMSVSVEGIFVSQSLPASLLPHLDTTMSTMTESTSDSESDDCDIQTTISPAFVHTSELSKYKYALTHVFLPVELPNQNDYALDKDHSLARAVCPAAHAYIISPHIYGTSQEAQWHHITKMLDNLQVSVQSEHLDNDHIISQLRGMQPGGMFTVVL